MNKLLELAKRGMVREDDDNSIPGAGGGVEEQSFMPDYNDPVIQAEIARQADERTAKAIADYKASIPAPQPQYQYPQQFQQPQTPQTPEQIKKGYAKRLQDAPTWDDSVDIMADMIYEAEQRAKRETLEELKPLIQHSAVQSATSMVMKHVPNVPAEARQFIDDAVRDLGLRPQDLDNPSNAAFVADAAEMRAIRAGKITTAAAPPTATEARANLLNQNRTPVAAPAPVVTPSVKSWKDDLTPEEQAHIENLMIANTPKKARNGKTFTVEEVWTPAEIDKLKHMMRNPLEALFR